jgi:hypothetical protein
VLNNFVKKKESRLQFTRKKKTGNSISNGHKINPGKVRFNVQIQNGFFPNKTEINTPCLQQTLFSIYFLVFKRTHLLCAYTYREHSAKTLINLTMFHTLNDLNLFHERAFMATGTHTQSTYRL